MDELDDLAVSGEAPDQKDLFHGFDPRIRDAVDGLTFLGYLESDPIDFCGHTFVLKTLNGEEELLAGLIVKEYVETFGQAKAWEWARIALALVSVDGDSDFCPPAGPNKVANARARFQYLTSGWFWPTCEFLLGEWHGLNTLQLEAYEAIQNLSVRDLTNSSSMSDSWIVPDTSSELPNET